MSDIVWLASYPKSGNTWLRIFLTNFQRDSDRPVDINALDFASAASDRCIFDSAMGVSSADLTDAEIESYRPSVFRHIAHQSPRTLYVKTHDAYTLTASGEPLIPADVSRGAIYVARNPLDIAVSFAHHFRNTLEQAVDRLAAETMTLSEGTTRLRTQLKQRLLSWSGHVLSWLDQDPIPVHLMRYEDMSLRPIETFSAAVRFLGWPEDEDRIRRAVEFSRFDVLRGQEESKGFKERQPGASSFFREGKVGSWREVLTEDQIGRIGSCHGTVMQRLGYFLENMRGEGIQ